MGDDSKPWGMHDPKAGAPTFSILIESMRLALQNSPQALDEGFLHRKWSTGIAVACHGTFEKVCSVPFDHVDQALRAYTELASMYLSSPDSQGVFEEVRVPLARSIGRAMAFAQHGGSEYQEYVDHLVGRGGESLILGPLLITVSAW